HGAADDDYVSMGRTYRPRHGPFRSVDELKLVLGITPNLFDRIRPAITVYTRKPSIDPSVAPREALAALYIDNPTALEQELDRRNGSSNGTRSDGVIAPGVSTAGRVFSVTVTLAKGDRHYRRSAVVLPTGDDSEPFLTLAWK